MAGPHPFLGGNMQNNVVRGVANGLAQRGFVTLRFDYAGVGESQGPEVDVAGTLAEFWRTSHAPGEMAFYDDVRAATHCVPSSMPLVLIGYSFGCALLPHVRPQQDLAGLVLIAPTVAKHNYDSFLAVTCPVLVIASEDDFATDARELEHWVAKLRMPRQLIGRRCDNHFFRGFEDWLTETISLFLDGLGI